MLRIASTAMLCAVSLGAQGGDVPTVEELDKAQPQVVRRIVERLTQVVGGDVTQASCHVLAAAAAGVTDLAPASASRTLAMAKKSVGSMFRGCHMLLLSDLRTSSVGCCEREALRCAQRGQRLQKATHTWQPWLTAVFNSTYRKFPTAI